MSEDGFLRIPNALLEALLRVRLTETSWRILLWVIRQTYGWNRKEAPYSWYRIARDLSMDRGGVARSGNKLLGAKVLSIRDGRLAVQEDDEHWDRRIFCCPCDDTRQLWMPGISDDKRHRKPMTDLIATDDGRHRKRCPASSVFRRAINSSKDNIKTNKDTHTGESDDARHRSHSGEARDKTALQQVMNYYIAFRGETLSKEQTSAFYHRFGKAAKALLEACSQSVEKAEEAITRIGSHLNQERLSWTLETVHKWYCDPSILKSSGQGESANTAAGAARPIPGKYDGISEN
jgi:phage replication O-like protein O